MKNILILISFFILVIYKAESQNLKEIKKQNTFFILFEDKNESSWYKCTDKLPFNFKSCNYLFFKSNKKEFEYSFRYSEYPNADKKHNNIDKCMLFRIDKSFLRKNKDIIITREFMEKMGDTKMISLLDDDGANKTIFLINTADTKNGKILVREVTISYTPEE